MSTETRDSHGNKVSTRPYKPDEGLMLRKVPADSVPYGESVSLNGVFVWGAYDELGNLLFIAPTAEAARRKYREHRRTKSVYINTDTRVSY